MKTFLGTFINDPEIFTLDLSKSNVDSLYINNIVKENSHLLYSNNRKYLALYCDLYFQPVVDVETQEVIFFEALLRNKPTRAGLQNLSMLLDYLHSCPVTHSEFYEWKIEKIAKILRENTYPVSDKAVSINVRPSNWVGPNLVKTFQNVFKAYNLSPDRLIIEVTEDYNIKNYPIFIESLNRLNEIGFKLAVDDYGAGSATYTIFDNVDFDIMKIDKHFVNMIEKCPKNRILLENIVHLAKSLDMKTVAEGVESYSVSEILKFVGVDYVQGYYIERPLILSELKDKY